MTDIYKKYKYTTDKWDGVTETQVMWALKTRKILWGISAVLVAVGLFALWAFLPAIFNTVATILILGTGVISVIYGIVTMISKGAEVASILDKAERFGIVKDE